jgi:hypothetical protein
MSNTCTDQENLPSVPRPEKVIRVHVHSELKRLRVDAAEWDRMSDDEREEYVFEASLELGWFDVDFSEER